MPHLDAGVWLLCLEVALGAGQPGAISLFDGKTLTGWSGSNESWRIEDEAITGEIRAGQTLKSNELPGAEEILDESAKLLGYGYGPGYKGLVCTLLLSKNGIKLGISHGSELPDPKQLMQGSGKVHRHVPLRTSADLKQPGLKPLLKAALAAWKHRNENND